MPSFSEERKRPNCIVALREKKNMELCHGFWEEKLCQSSLEEVEEGKWELRQSSFREGKAGILYCGRKVRKDEVDKKVRDGILSVIEDMKKIDYIKPADVPNIDLYMDQVTTFMDKHLETTRRYSEDKLLTKTMINNYTKNNLLPSPNKKKYTKDHMYLLIFIYYLKNILSISDIQKVLKPLSENFFGEGKTLSLEGIYAEIFGLENEQSMIVTRDVVRKYQKSRGSFAGVSDAKEQKLLQDFALISMLSFDVYMKKQLIEALIDENTPDEGKDGKEGKEKETKGKEKAK